MPRHPHPHTRRLRRPFGPVLNKAREGNAEVPGDMELFFLELDALFAEEVGREERRRAHAQIADDMRRDLAREEVEALYVSSRQEEESQGATDVAVEPAIDRQDCTSGTGSSHAGIQTEILEIIASQSVLALQGSQSSDLGLNFPGRTSSMLLFSDIAPASLPQIGWPWGMGFPLQLRQIEYL